MRTSFHASLCIAIFCGSLFTPGLAAAWNATTPEKEANAAPQSLMPTLTPPQDNFADAGDTATAAPQALPSAAAAPQQLTQPAPLPEAAPPQPVSQQPAPQQPIPPVQPAAPQPPAPQAAQPTAPTTTPAPTPVAAEPATPEAQQITLPAPAPEPETQVQVPAQPQQPAVAEQPPSEREQVVLEARNGEYDHALPVLHRIHKEHPEDIGVTRDLLAVSSWAHIDAEAVALYKTLPEGPEPDYVLEAVGKSYRNLGKPKDALAVYETGLKQSPDNVNFAAGEIRSLMEAGYIEKALKAAKADLEKNGERLDVLLAAADAADQYNLTYESLRYYQNALIIAPKDREALHGVMHIEDEMGAPQLAHKLADQHPGIISPAEYRHIEGDEAAAQVRWGPLEPPNDSQRYAETDHAIQSLDALIVKWSKAGRGAQSDVLRARFDRMVALRDRTRMQNVVDEYNELRQEGIAIPPYVLTAVGDAYLYLRQPEAARDLYLEALKYDPKDFEAKRQLYYAYVECGDFDAAYDTIDSLDAEQPVWIRLKGAADPEANNLREAADRDAGLARLYGNELGEADDRISKLTFAAPYNARNRQALGDVYSTRGWPRAALEQFQTGTALQNGQDVGNEAGAALANLDLQNFREAEAQINDLAARYPENIDVQRAERLWQVHNMAELDVKGYYAFKPSTSVNGGQGFGIDAMLYSQPIDYNWRLFAGNLYAHEEEPNNEGRVSLERTTAGIEYRDGPVTASLAPTDSMFHAENRIGVTANGAYAFGDQWSADLDGEILSKETPLRALNAGITADSVNGTATWRQSEARELVLGAGVMPFSDSNLRTEQSAAYTQQLYADSQWTLEGLGDLGASQNSKDENRPYYNPASDLMALAGARVTQVLYRRYETLYEHSVTVKPGAYWEQNFGTSAAFDMRYEQRIHYNDTLNAGVGVDFARQAYDGAYENDISLTFDISERF
jgi:biofilm PGA synthesis protein PgaA